MKTSFDFIKILLSIIIIRIITILLVGKIPLMDPDYLIEGKQIFSGDVTQLVLTPAYAIIIYFLDNLTKDLFVASSMIFVFSSVVISVMVYLICKEIYDEDTAKIALILSIFFPNISVAVSGYSHTVIFAVCFECMALFFLWKSFQVQSVKNLIYGLFCLLLAIYLRPEFLVVIVAYIILLTLIVIPYRSELINLTKTNNESTPKKGIDSIWKLTANNIALITISFCVVCTLLHKLFVASVSADPQYAGVFSGKMYSYWVWIQANYSFRLDGTFHIQPEIVNAIVGTPEQNEYSIFKAILASPSGFLLNILFNLKSLLKSFMQPLFMPFYMYFFVGIAFVGAHKMDSLGLIKSCMLPLLFLLHTVPLILLHVEIRYMAPLSIIFLIYIARGLALINWGRTTILYIVSFLNLTVYSVYILASRG